LFTHRRAIAVIICDEADFLSGIANERTVFSGSSARCISWTPLCPLPTNAVACLGLAFLSLGRGCRAQPLASLVEDILVRAQDLVRSAFNWAVLSLWDALTPDTSSTWFQTCAKFGTLANCRRDFAILVVPGECSCSVIGRNLAQLLLGIAKYRTRQPHIGVRVPVWLAVDVGRVTAAKCVLSTAAGCSLRRAILSESRHCSTRVVVYHNAHLLHGSASHRTRICNPLCHIRLAPIVAHVHEGIPFGTASLKCTAWAFTSFWLARLNWKCVWGCSAISREIYGRAILLIAVAIERTTV